MSDSLEIFSFVVTVYTNENDYQFDFDNSMLAARFLQQVRDAVGDEAKYSELRSPEWEAYRR